jgi:hypothetical protein
MIQMDKRRLRLFKPTSDQLKALAKGREKSALYRAGKKRHDENLRSGKGKKKP